MPAEPSKQIITIDGIVKQFNKIIDSHEGYFERDTSRTATILTPTHAVTLGEAISNYFHVHSARTPLVQVTYGLADISSEQDVGYILENEYDDRGGDVSVASVELRVLKGVHLKNKKWLPAFKLARTFTFDGITLSSMSLKRNDTIYRPIIGRIPLIGHHTADLTPYFPDECVTSYAKEIAKNLETIREQLSWADPLIAR